MYVEWYPRDISDPEAVSGSSTIILYLISCTPWSVFFNDFASILWAKNFELNLENFVARTEAKIFRLKFNEKFSSANKHERSH